MITQSRQPPTSNTGVSHPKNDPDSLKTGISISARIDWLSLSVPECATPKATHIFDEIYRGAELQDRPHMGYRNNTECLLTGARLLTDSFAGNERITIELPGQACQFLGDVKEVLTPWADLYPLLTNVPRIDLAIDLMGDVSHVIPSLIESHRSGNIHPALAGNVQQGFDAKTLTDTGHSYYLGATSSDKRVNIYDKGVQTGEFGPGKWVRWESRFRNQPAVVVLQSLINDPSENLLRRLAAGICTSISGPFEETYNLLTDSPLRVSKTIAPRSALKTLDNLRNVLQVLVEAAAITGDNPVDLIDHFGLLDKKEGSRNPRRTAVAREIINLYTMDTNK